MGLVQSASCIFHCGTYTGRAMAAWGMFSWVIAGYQRVNRNTQNLLKPQFRTSTLLFIFRWSKSVTCQNPKSVRWGSHGKVRREGRIVSRWVHLPQPLWLQRYLVDFRGNLKSCFSPLSLPTMTLVFGVKDWQNWNRLKFWVTGMGWSILDIFKLEVIQGHLDHYFRVAFLKGHSATCRHVI